MINITVTGLDDVKKSLGDLTFKLPSVIARGLTETAKDVKKEVYGWMPRVFDRPTPYTMRSLFVYPALKEDLRAAVSFKYAAGSVPRHFMDNGPGAPRSIRSQVFGGQRPLKASEKALLRNGITKPSAPYLIPGPGAPLNMYGNVSGAFMNKVLYSGVKMGSASQGYHVPLNNRRQADTKRGEFFVMARNFGQHPVGIFRNMGKRRPPSPIFFFASKAQYKQKLPFYSIASAVVTRQLNKRIVESIDVVIAKYRM